MWTFQNFAPHKHAQRVRFQEGGHHLAACLLTEWAVVVRWVTYLLTEGAIVVRWVAYLLTEWAVVVRWVTYLLTEWAVVVLWVTAPAQCRSRAYGQAQAWSQHQLHNMDTITVQCVSRQLNHRQSSYSNSLHC